MLEENDCYKCGEANATCGPPVGPWLCDACWETLPFMASVQWSPADVEGLRPDWPLDRCEEFLEKNERLIRDTMVRAGWRAMWELLPDEDGGKPTVYPEWLLPDAMTMTLLRPVMTAFDEEHEGVRCPVCHRYKDDCGCAG